MWSSASPRFWAAATAISSRSLTFAWPVKSEKRDGRNVSSNATSGLFNVEIGRSAIAGQNGRTPNERQGERGDRGFEGLLMPPPAGCIFSHPRGSMCVAYSAIVSLSPRGRSGGRVGEGGVRTSPVDASSSPRPSPPSGGGEGEENSKG